MLPLLRSLYRRMDDHELTGRAAQIAFYFLITIFPLLLAVIGVLSTLRLDAYVTTLDYFMDDYVTHLERHMAQVLGPTWAE